jgi:threonine dehydratase
MPVWSDVRKQRMISAMGCDLVIAGETASECEHIAQQTALEREGVVIHPYRSLSQIEGYTSLWRQIADRYPNGADVIVPVGSGGLLAGGLLQRTHRPDRLHIIAVESSPGAKLRENLAAGAEIRAGGQSMSASALNVDVIPDMVRRILQGADFSHITVSDEEICGAESELVSHGIAADAGAAAGFAAAMFLKLPRRYARLAVILTGRGGLEIRRSRWGGTR